MSEIAATFRRPFAEQVAAFRLRLGNLVPTSAWDDLWKSQHDRGFMVAGATKAALLADLAAAVDKAISEGATLDEFRRDFRAIVTKHGWHGWTGEGTKAGEAWRTRVIYRTNMATSYAAGRMAQLTAAGFKYWIYRHGASIEPRLQHLAWDGVALPPDHPFWETHAPPNGWGCTCYVVGARSASGVRRVGGDPDKPLPSGWRMTDARTGEPVGIDRGWGYAPGASVVDEILTGRLPRLPAPVGAALFAAVAPAAVDDIARRFDAFVTTALATRIEKNFIVIGALKPEWIAEASARGVEVKTAEIAVTDLNVQHTFRGTPHVTHQGKHQGRAPKHEPLDLAWYRGLPTHLMKPSAVLLDQTGPEPVFLLLYDVPGRVAKLVVEIDTPIRKAGGKMNTVQTGRMISRDDVAGMLGRGVEVISGALD